MVYKLDRELNSPTSWEALIISASKDTCYTFDRGLGPYDYGFASYWFTQVSMPSRSLILNADGTQSDCPRDVKRQPAEVVLV